MSREELANKLHGRCRCHDRSGDCEWCRVYYGWDEPDLEEPKPLSMQQCGDIRAVHRHADAWRGYALDLRRRLRALPAQDGSAGKEPR